MKEPTCFRNSSIAIGRKDPKLSTSFVIPYAVLCPTYSREKWMEHKILLINNYSSFLSPVALIKYWLTIPERSIFHFCLFTTNVQLFLVKFLEFVLLSPGYIFIFHIPATWSNVKVCILVEPLSVQSASASASQKTIRWIFSFFFSRSGTTFENTVRESSPQNGSTRGLNLMLIVIVLLAIFILAIAVVFGISFFRRHQCHKNQGKFLVSFAYFLIFYLFIFLKYDEPMKYRSTKWKSFLCLV